MDGFRDWKKEKYNFEMEFRKLNLRQSFVKIEKVKSQMPDWPYCKVLFGVPMSKCAFLPHQFRVRDFVSRFELFSSLFMIIHD